MRKINLFFAVVAFFLSCVSGFAQNIQVTGTITDSSTGEIVVGATVQLKGSTSVYALSDVDGTYKINVPANGILVFNCLGYTGIEAEVGGQRIVNVALQPETQKLDDVIVVAFGTSTKESFTGSAATVKSDDIARVQSSNATRSIEGMVAGVQMTTSSGTLGKTPAIRIRGISSISAENAPLYVIDGIPYSGDMNNINPSDIESITVLKDAASNSLYGSRGANGVIMITTKRAKAGEAVVNVDAKWGVNTKALQNYDYITDPGQYYETYYSALYNYNRLVDGLDKAAAHLKAATTTVGPVKGGGLGYDVFTYPEGELLIGSNGKINPKASVGRLVDYKGKKYWLQPDNWMEHAYKQSFRQEYNVNVSGTTGKAQIYASFGYLNDNGIIQAANMQRYTSRIKADYQAKSWLKVGGNAAYTNFNFNNGNKDEGSAGSVGNVFGAAAGIAPIYPLFLRDEKKNIIYDIHGNRRYDYGDGSNGGFVRSVFANSNALQEVSLNVNNSEGNAFNATGYVEVRFLKDLKFTFNVGTGLDETRSTEMVNMWYGQYAVNGGVISKSHQRSQYINLQQILDYNKTIAGKHHVSLMLGHENYNTTKVTLEASKKNMFSIDNLELNGAVIDGQQAASTKGQYNTEGYFARALYDYDSKIFTSLSYRRDASSRFHPDHRWGDFWSAGLGYLINKESWFNAPWVDLLKLKASVGSQGNDGIGEYRYTDTYTISNNEGKIAVSFNTKGNEKITWETNTNINAGVDFELFGRKLTGSAEYFYRKTSDMLFWFSVPQSLGYNGYYDNIGDMRNAGVEFSLNYNIVNTEHFAWSVNGNLTHYKNKIIRLPEERKTTTTKAEGYKGYATGNKFVGEGLPINTFYIYKYAGVDKTDGLPMWYMEKEVEKDGKKVTERITTKEYSKATQYICADTTPKAYGGFGTSLELYGFDFSVQCTYSIGGKTYDSGYANLVTNPSGTPGGSFHKDVLKAWTPENKDSDFPRFVYQDKNITSASDRFLVDASYLNIQNAQIGYTLPASLVHKAKLGSVRIYATCDNIWYWSRRKGLDPRYSFTGETNYASNSPVRTISGGIRLTF